MTAPIKTLRIIPRESDFLDRKTGQSGEIFYDKENNTLRLYSGNLGGTSLAKADLTNVSNSTFAAKATAAGVGGGGGNTTVSVGSSVPASPSNGNLWLNTNNGSLYVYINDGTSSQWIQPSVPFPDLTGYATETSWKIAADDSTVYSVPSNETLQIRGQGGVTTSLSLDSTGVQLIIQGAAVDLSAYATSNDIAVAKIFTDTAYFQNDEDIFVDVLQYQHVHWAGEFTATRTIFVENLMQQTRVLIYVKNISAGSQGIEIQASETTSGFTAVDLARGGGGSTGNQITLEPNGAAWIQLMNAGGGPIGMMVDPKLLTGMQSLQFAVGSTVSEFSTDATFTDNSSSAVPTESAVRAYIDRRLGFEADGSPVLGGEKIGPNYVITEGQQQVDLGNQSYTSDADYSLDASTVMLASWIASISATRTLIISNLTAGRMAKVYVRNTNGTPRQINVTASLTAAGHAAVNLAGNFVGANAAGQVSATAVTLAASTGTAVITVWNAGGTIVGQVS